MGRPVVTDRVVHPFYEVDLRVKGKNPLTFKLA